MLLVDSIHNEIKRENYPHKDFAKQIGELLENQFALRLAFILENAGHPHVGQIPFRFVPLHIQRTQADTEQRTFRG